MRHSPASHPVLRIFRDVLLVDILIFLTLAAIHLFVGWQSARQFGSGLVWAGAIGVILLLINAGWRDGRRQDWVALSQVMHEPDVFYLLNSDNSGRARFLLVGLLALTIALALGLILQNIP